MDTCGGLTSDHSPLDWHGGGFTEDPSDRNHFGGESHLMEQIHDRVDRSSSFGPGKVEADAGMGTLHKAQVSV